MVDLHDQCNMRFGGMATSPCALVEVKLWGQQVDAQGSEKMTQEILALLQEQLSISPSRCYVRYLASLEWGFGKEE